MALPFRVRTTETRTAGIINSIQKIRFVGMDWVHLPQNRDRCRRVNRAMNLSGSIKDKQFLD
jgi:hypothetical protein